MGQACNKIKINHKPKKAVCFLKKTRKRKKKRIANTAKLSYAHNR